MSVDPDRIAEANQAPTRSTGEYVLYWMSASQRTIDNHALSHAVNSANELGVPVLVCFAFTRDYPEATARSLTFMVEGLVDVATSLHDLGIGFHLEEGDPVDVVTSLATKASLVVVDKGYLKLDRLWRSQIGRSVGVAVVEVESNAVVPVHKASQKQEYAARTLRPKILRLVDQYLDTGPTPRPDKVFAHPAAGLDPSRLLADVAHAGPVSASQRFRGGTTQGLALLNMFVTTGLRGYATARSDPSQPRTSELSPYFHFGQLSPITVAQVAIDEAREGDDSSAYLEQLIVRRELALNFVTYQPCYDEYAAVPAWAQKTLRAHVDDPRPQLLTLEDLESAATPDRYWNAAMVEMLTTGYMHNYMRMYWGKRILAWAPTPEHAFLWILHLNNKYFIDGRDPVSYASIGWLFGLHDRPWPEREIFGTVRSMTPAGLKRKFDIDAYVAHTVGLA